MKNFIVIGARGYGRVVYNISQDFISSGEYLVVKVFLDDKSDALDGSVGYPHCVIKNHKVLYGFTC